MSARDTAIALIAKKGKTVTLTSRTAGSYSPSTGAATVTTATQSVKAVILPLTQGVRKMSGADVPQGDVQCLLSPETTAGVTLTGPDINDTVTDVNGRVLSVVEVAPLAPDGTTVLYDCKLRSAA